MFTTNFIRLSKGATNRNLKEIPVIDKHIRLLLGSKSPRRRELLKNANIDFEIVDIKSDESYDPAMPVKDVAAFLSRKKSLAYLHSLNTNEILLTADTIVVCDQKILGKPENIGEAKKMLSLLSGRAHQVITGFCLRSPQKTEVFSAISKVYFKILEKKEIEYYIRHFKPFDKAGAYGIQEWIGHIAVEKIEGSFYNVMGLPVAMVYDKLLHWHSVKTDK
jgi:septum formation protein